MLKESRHGASWMAYVSLGQEMVRYPSASFNRNMEPSGGDGTNYVLACNPSSDKARKPFHKWMKTLRRRAVQRQNMVPSKEPLFPDRLPANNHGFRLPRSYHTRKSSSGSSAAFVTAMKSASVSVVGTSFLSKSRRNTLRSSHGHSRTDRSSGASIAHPRLSTDSTWAEGPIVVDQAVTERSLQRRRILEELVETEESYIGDVRFLMNVRYPRATFPTPTII
jgi:hypothetical protein